MIFSFDFIKALFVLFNLITEYNITVHWIYTVKKNLVYKWETKINDAAN